MPTPADAPLRKVTLNLYEADVIGLEAMYGHGWSANVRQLVHEHVATSRKEWLPPKRTLSDLGDHSD